MEGLACRPKLAGIRPGSGEPCCPSIQIGRCPGKGQVRDQALELARKAGDFGRDLRRTPGLASVEPGKPDKDILAADLHLGQGQGVVAHSTYAKGEVQISHLKLAGKKVDVVQRLTGKPLVHPLKCCQPRNHRGTRHRHRDGKPDGTKAAPGVECPARHVTSGWQTTNRGTWLNRSAAGYEQTTTNSFSQRAFCIR